MAGRRYSFDAATGEIALENGDRHPFLPARPAQSPPYELVVPGVEAGAEDDGAAHYLIGGDPEIVQQIVDWYAAKGSPVPDGYADEAARHAQAVRDELGKQAE